MIINKTLVSFAGRTPSPRYVPVGVVGDNLVECVEFRLPTIDADQTATMLLKCKYADAITLTRTDTMTYCADITAQIAGESGKLEAYIRIDGAGGAVWNSEPFMLCVCNVPDISGDVEDWEPGALEQTLSAIAAHNAAMKQHSEDMEDATESASESAENAAEAAGRAEAAAKRAEEISEPYILPVATADTLGGVKVGEGLNVDEDGRVRVDPQKHYTKAETDAAISEATNIDKPMRLIAETVITDEVRGVVLNVDSNGKAFNLKNIYVEFDVVAKRSSYQVLYLNDKSMLYIADGAFPAGNMKLRATFEIKNNRCFCSSYGVRYAAGGYGDTAYIKTYGHAIGMTEMENITGIAMYDDTTPFERGTRLAVYEMGVRA